MANGTGAASHAATSTAAVGVPSSDVSESGELSPGSSQYVQPSDAETHAVTSSFPCSSQELISLLLGEEDLPHPQIDFAAFDKALTSALERTPLVYDPLRKRREHWVNMRKLRSHYGGVSHCCVIC